MNGLKAESGLAAFAAACEAELDRALPLSDPDIDRVTEAMRYSLLGGGKRLRPYLVSAFSELHGGDAALAMCFGCALEMVHTYSLIHDDLPAMDNDDLRRGRPTCHRAFDEATAILAGDGLLTRAFGLLAECDADAETGIKAVAILAEAAGHIGMIGGQMMDIAAESVPPSRETLEKLQNKKTGAMIAAACRLGCLAAGISEGVALADAVRYAERLGLAFQVVDDLLDAVGNEETFGKPIGSDAKLGKVTFYSLLGESGARRFAEELTREACEALEAYPGADALLSLAESMLSRDH